jgi:DNA-binding NtrC family response regulator
MGTPDTVLVLDDEASIRLAIRTVLESHGYRTLEAERCEEAAIIFRRTRPDAIILDYLLPDGDALDLMRKIRDTDADVPIILLTAHGSIDLAVRAVKQGAEHFFTKPVELPALMVVLKRAIENQRSHRRELAGRSDGAKKDVDPFVGESPAIRTLRDQAQKVLQSDRPVMVLGETGSGKGVVARWLHRLGPRAKAAFVDINCAALSRELLETELFGHAKGAFTGADARKLGLLEVAHRGTLFLDEIGDVDQAVQPKLLTVIEEMRFRRLGEVRDILVDVRIIAATHRDLADRVQQQLFRADLYFRISALPLRVPPLRERSEDIPVLADHFVERIAAELGKGKVELTPAAIGALQSYAWPGNIRELRNVLERAVLLTDHSKIGPRDLVFETAPPPVPNALPGLDTTLAELERGHILRVLEAEDGNIPQAARRLGLPRSTLYTRLKGYGIKA